MRNGVTVLKLDHDPHARRLTIRELLKRAKRAHRTIVALGERRSPSGRGWHRWLVVRPAPRTPLEIVALQLLFGSDPYREAYLINRATQIVRGRVPKAWCDPRMWNVFYKRPDWGRDNGTR